jgi:DNA polymerase-3 subunit alpha
VVISPRPLTELVPLHKTKNDEIVTAFDMVAIEKLGLLKMDFLGLTTLTILDDTIKLIAQTRELKLDLAKLPLDDAETYQKVFYKGLTSGVFQFESHGMRDVLRRYQPNSIEDLTALNALYRPGPIQGGMIDDFIDRKHGRKKIEYELPELKEILEETLGVIVYQEQVMQIANRLAGYSLGEADLLRRAMGKKKPEEMAQQRERFVEGATQRSYPAKKIEKIFDLMAQFAGYGFNKSHSAAYALLAYQTAYLKTHYPVEFMAALLTSVTGNTDDVVKYINECREMGIAVEPPDINVSDANFTPHGQAIRFGLAAVKNVGHNAIESIVAGRKKSGSYRDIFEFAESVDLRLLNKRVLESLIKSGAMDSMGRRAQLMAVIDRAIERAQKAQRDAESGQHGLFGVFQQDEAPATHEQLPNVPDWDEHQRLASEKEILGFFITGHPLEKYADKLQGLNALSISDVSAMKASTGKDETITTAGIIGNLRVAKAKKTGELWAQGTLEDTSGSIEMLVFPEAYRRLQEKVKLEVPVLVKAGVRVEEGSNPKITVADITPLEDAKVPLPRSLRIRIPVEGANENTVDALHNLFTERKGEARVLFDVERQGDFMVVMEAEGYNVHPDRNFIARVEELCGRGSVRIIN